jgi:16S rRNA (uracil1498-N3)-methyltransferase
MRINRFFGNFDLGAENIKISDKKTCHQIKDVLKIKPGERIILSNGGLKETLVEIVKIDKAGIEVKTIEAIINNREPKIKVILYCSILKGEHFEVVTEKATEVGVSRIVPIICERTIKTGIKKERLEKIIKEAAEQSGRIILPVLEEETDFKKSVTDAQRNDLNLFFDLSGERISAEIKKPGKIGVFIGPEGGWSEKELKTAEDNNFKIVSLSKLTFRAETAAIIASYLASL